MSVIKGQSHIEVFENFSQITAFFSLKKNASNGSPYFNEKLFKELKICKAVVVQPKQIHSDKVAVIDMGMKKDAVESGGLDDTNYDFIRLADTDAIITDITGVLLTSVHADCLPVYFYDTETKAIGLAHAGWRGTVGGIAPKTYGKMFDIYSSRAENIHVYIGPGISQCCFETGTEVYAQFMKKWDFAGKYMEKREKITGETKYNIDLKSINKKQLEAVGIPEKNIEVSGYCTCCDKDLFCSYRRENGSSMRMGAGIFIKDKEDNVII